MAQEQIAIASAVVLPDDAPPSPGHKRRISSVSGSDPKRRRLGADEHDDDNVRVHEDDPGHASPERGNGRRANGQAEERKRGQRLFGALLGTLSQNHSSSTAQRRRADIEKKQQTKLKQQAEEYDARKREELDRLRAARRREQKRFDEQSMRIRHSNMLAMAHCLCTSTEPRLYYKPWKLSQAEELRIAAQIDEAEAVIEGELRDFARRSSRDQAEPGQISPHSNQDGRDDRAATDEHRAPPEQTMEYTGETSVMPNDAAQERSPSNTPVPHSTALANGGSSKARTPSVDERQGNTDTADADGGEVVLEADEDTVIY